MLFFCSSLYDFFLLSLLFAHNAVRMSIVHSFTSLRNYAEKKRTGMKILESLVYTCQCQSSIFNRHETALRSAENTHNLIFFTFRTTKLLTRKRKRCYVHLRGWLIQDSESKHEFQLRIDLMLQINTISLLDFNHIVDIKLCTNSEFPGFLSVFFRLAGVNK